MILTTAQQMKQLDQRTIQEFGLSGPVLMENAARGAVQVIQSRYPQARSIAVFCGKGNNGGDGLVIARYFHSLGLKVNVYLVGPKSGVKGDAALQLLLTNKLKVPLVELTDKMDLPTLRQTLLHNDLVVDALLGTGLEKKVQGLFREVILLMNELPIPKIAIDIPSGLSSDSGQPLGLCTQAALTITFGLPKIGQILFPGCRFVGRLFVIDIGIPPIFHPAPKERMELLEPNTFSPFLPKRDPEGHKGLYGHVLVLAGSKGKTGAAAMTCLGALRAGAGLVTLGIPESLNTIMEIKLTEAMTEPLPEGEPGALGPKALKRIQSLCEGKKALALGPGLSQSSGTKSLVQALLKRIKDIPLVIDADGLNALAEAPEGLKTLAGRAILTPHPGEMARLSGQSVKEIQADRIQTARTFSKKIGVVVVLKGARTVIADPEGAVYLNPFAHSILASGGTGDILTGLILGFLSQGLSPIKAACLGVFLHGQAGAWLARERGGQGILASELLEKIPGLFSQKDYWDCPEKESIPLIREIFL
jgi:yjeF C-terminal region, hydroxyethylthiazole kinase-related/yjeF N-terminal region